ncbi:MAG: DUF523 domain-containing protein [Thiotrichales bacterium]
MEKILVSACLLGKPVRYDGTDKALDAEIWEQWMREGRLVPVCPEVSGGLPVPRPPAEIVGGSGVDVLNRIASVINEMGQDVTTAFVEGAKIALSVAQSQGIRLAVFTEGSPSCGSYRVYDGSFSGQKVSGEGVTIALLRQAGIAVFSHLEIVSALRHLTALEKEMRKI